MKHLSTIATLAASCLICLIGLRVASNHAFQPLDLQTAAQSAIHVPRTVLTTRYESNREFAQLELPIENLGTKRLIVRTREANCDCFFRPGSIVVEAGESENLPLPFPMVTFAYRNQIDLVLVTNDPQHRDFPITIKVENPLPRIPENAISVLHPSPDTGS